ncbi:hypothetical protein CWATWH8502_357 [Crocosphaera watsonii WH 8502]|uniref:Uncharacterized protein n=1 Tax=Crocosphaera watsonii WH 8502 TaxID=423474 RepID=T2I9Y2_CROWT|nr:hypothetical protein CWATWH8502_357 [Crocosphaera watsonii WH 8502]
MDTIRQQKKRTIGFAISSLSTLALLVGSLFGMTMVFIQ